MICSLQLQVKYQVNYVLTSVEFLRRNPPVVWVACRHIIFDKLCAIVLNILLNFEIYFLEFS